MTTPSATSGPVLRQVTIRSGSTGRLHGGGRARSTVVIASVVLVIGLAAGAFGGRQLWKVNSSSTSSVKAAQATLQKSTNALFLQAYNLQRQGKLSDALQQYVQIVAINPVNYYAYYDLALIYQQTGHPTDATIDYEKALLVYPSYQPALYNLATLESTSNPTEAIALYLQLQALRPTNADAVAFNLGLLYLKEGETKQGAKELQYAVKLTPSLKVRVPKQYQSLLTSSTT